MRNKSGLVVLIGVFFSLTVRAQQVPFYNFNIKNPVVFNPAFAGIDGNLDAYFTRGQRFMGYGSGAINNLLSLDGKFFIPHSGFGLTVSQSSIGIMNQLGASLSYAYHLKFNDDNFLSLGLNGGFLDNRLNTDAIDVLRPEDPFLAGMSHYRPTYNFNFGLLYRWKDLKIGLSVPQLIGNKVKFSKNNTRGYYHLARHFMGTASYDFHLPSAPKITLSPYALVRYIVGAPLQYDVTARVAYKNLGWFSATYKSDYAVQFNIGFDLFKHLHLGYSYEYIIGSFKNHYTGVNHEIMVGYTFGGKTKKITEIDTVRVKDPLLIKENQRLKDKVQDLEGKIKDMLAQRVKDSLRLAELQKKAEANNEFKNAKDSDYHFINKNGSASPAGYYVVIGVYSEHKNTLKNLRKNKGKYPDIYYVINQLKENYEYITIKYTKDLQEAFDTLKSYKEKTGHKVWILKYKM